MIVEISYSCGSFTPVGLSGNMIVTGTGGGSVKVYVEGITVAEWDRYWVPFLRSLRGGTSDNIPAFDPSPSPESPFTRRIEIEP